MSINVEFGSDNHSGVHPDILKEINRVNSGFSIAYGGDSYTKKALRLFNQHFGKNIKVYFVYNGTASNILGIKNVTESYNSIICPESAHLNVHECCGPEKFTGCKLVTIPTEDGKLTVDLIKLKLIGFDDPHMAQPKIISITQPTEYGTVYTTKEIKKLTEFAHKNNLLVHVDGARLSNAAAHLNKNFKEITTDLGVDFLSFGGTKNGSMFAEAVIFFNKKHAENFEYIRKQGMQLASKMRYISAQFIAFFSNDLWLKNAQHANNMASFLEEELKKIKSIQITQKVETNMVFARFPKDLLEKIRKKYYFHVFDENNYEARLVCSFNTKKEDISDFIKTIKSNI